MTSLLGLENIKNWFFDIDDTLIDTAGVNQLAAEGMGIVIADNHSVELTKQFVNEFVTIFDLMLLGYRVKNEKDWEGRKRDRDEFEQLIKKIEDLQAPVRDKWGSIKKWSREVFIFLAGKKCGINVTPKFVQETADAYWLTLTEKTIIFPGAKKLIDLLQARNMGVYLITSSDGRLIMRDDGLFEYDPGISEALKRQRIELLRKRGIHFDVLSVGDPEDKPHIDFFMKGLRAVEEFTGKPVNKKESVMVGDSFAGDLLTPLEQMGFANVVLFEKIRRNFEIDGRIIKTGDLGLLADRI